jgi:hypothetical protein
MLKRKSLRRNSGEGFDSVYRKPYIHPSFKGEIPRTATLGCRILSAEEYPKASLGDQYLSANGTLVPFDIDFSTLTVKAVIGICQGIKSTGVTSHAPIAIVRCHKVERKLP